MGKQSNELTIKDSALSKGGIQLTTMKELMDLAQIIIDSGLAPKNLKNKESIIIAIQFGLEIGLSPMSSMQSVAVINGMPTIWGDCAKALVLSDSCCEYIKESHTGNIEKGDYVCTCESKRYNNDALVTTFSIDDAKRAGLWNKNEMWKKYPKRMLMFRSRSYNLRDNFPDVLKGFKTTEEVADYEIIGSSTKTQYKKDVRDSVMDNPPE